MPTGTEPGVLQSRLLEAYAVDLVPEDAVRWLFQQPPTPHRAGMPTISVVPTGEERRRV